MEDQLAPKELPSSPENKLQAYIDRASKIVADRYETVALPIKEVSLKLLKRRRLPLTLLAAFIIASSGCANSEESIQMPVFEAAAAASTPNPPEPTATPSATDKLKYKDRLPADIVSEKELWEKYHTKIWNTDKVKLHLRRAALENEPIFEDLQKEITPIYLMGLLPSWNPVTLKLEDRPPLPLYSQLDVVLIPGRLVRSINMSSEQKQSLPELYNFLRNDENKAWETAKREITQRGPLLVQEFKRSIENADADYRAGKMSKENYDSHVRIVNERSSAYTGDLSKYNFDSYYNQYGFMPKYKTAAGMYIGGMGERAEFDEKGNAVAMRQRYYIPVAVPESGLDASLDPENSSFYDPATFRMDNDPEYPLIVPANVTTSIAIRHEFAHHATDHPYTDYVNLENYTRAYDKFLAGDDSLFYFVFETPRGNVVAERSDSGLL